MASKSFAARLIQAITRPSVSPLARSVSCKAAVARPTFTPSRFFRHTTPAAAAVRGDRCSKPETVRCLKSKPLPSTNKHAHGRYIHSSLPAFSLDGYAAIATGRAPDQASHKMGSQAALKTIISQKKERNMIKAHSKSKTALQQKMAPATSSSIYYSTTPTTFAAARSKASRLAPMSQILPQWMLALQKLLQHMARFTSSLRRLIWQKMPKSPRHGVEKSSSHIASQPPWPDTSSFSASPATKYLLDACHTPLSTLRGHKVPVVPPRHMSGSVPRPWPH